MRRALKAARQEQNLTLGEIAKFLGLPACKYRAIENGEPVESDYFLQLEQLLHVPALELMNNTPSRRRGKPLQKIDSKRTPSADFKTVYHGAPLYDLRREKKFSMKDFPLTLTLRRLENGYAPIGAPDLNTRALVLLQWYSTLLGLDPVEFIAWIKKCMAHCYKIRREEVETELTEEVEIYGSARDAARLMGIYERTLNIFCNRLPSLPTLGAIKMCNFLGLDIKELYPE